MMINKPIICWALVADGGQARFLKLQRVPREITLLWTLESESRHQPSRELVSDASGRAFHAKGPSAHARQPRADAHDQAEKQFAALLVDKLGSAAQRGDFDRLLLVADPRTLGNLRQAIDPGLAARIMQEEAVDLTNSTLPDVEKNLRRRLDWPI
jgi:protein required for attachment to host cells